MRLTKLHHCKLMKKTMKNLPLIFLMTTFLYAQSPTQNLAEVKPSPQQMAWQELEFGALIHVGPSTFLNQEAGDGSADPAVFQPADLDPEQWVLAAKAAGARYVVLVAKHEDGFCLWPTQTTSYSVKFRRANAGPW